MTMPILTLPFHMVPIFKLFPGIIAEMVIPFTFQETPFLLCSMLTS